MVQRGKCKPDNHQNILQMKLPHTDVDWLNTHLEKAAVSSMRVSKNTTRSSEFKFARARQSSKNETSKNIKGTRLAHLLSNILPLCVPPSIPHPFFPFFLPVPLPCTPVHVFTVKTDTSSLRLTLWVSALKRRFSEYS